VVSRWKVFGEFFHLRVWASPSISHIGDFVQAFFSLGLFAVVLVVEMVIRTTIAVTIALLDTVIWVAVVFAAAAPMILSGLYEAAIDRQVIDTIQDTVLDPSTIDTMDVKSIIPASPEPPFRPADYMRHRIHLLYALLVGNLVMEKGEAPPQSTGSGEGAGPETELLAYRDVKVLVNQITIVPFETTAVFRTMSEIAEKAEEPKGEESKKGAQVSNSEINTVVPAGVRPVVSKDKEASRLIAESHGRDEIERTRMRLNAMLDCQAGFGGTIGAPIVFFLGSFLVSIFGNLAQLGNNSNAHALAFGEWWITIPHVAIVSGCLLAGNNPNTLQAIMCNLQRIPAKTFSESLWKRLIEGKESLWTVLRDYLREDVVDVEKPSGTVDVEKLSRTVDVEELSRTALTWRSARKVFNSFFVPVYEAHYQPVWMWERGRSKRMWVKRVQEEKEYPVSKRPVHHTKAFSALRRHEPISDHEFRLPWNLFGLLPIEWLYILLLAVSLLFYPFVLATLTSYYTPTVGLSCRSFTFVIYFISQFWLGTLWIIDFHREEHYPLLWTPEIRFFKRHDIQIPTLFASLVWLGLLVAIFTSLVGTFMQISGVYRNCLCITPLGYWSNEDFYFQISDNSAKDIRYARQFWVSTGISAIALLLAVCYGGWWYQRHWRAKFVKLIDYVLNAKARYIPKPEDPQPASHKAESSPQEKPPTQDNSHTEAAANVAGKSEPEAQAANADNSQAEAHVANASPEKTQPETQAVNTKSDGAQPEPSAATKEVEPEIHVTNPTSNKSEPEPLAVDKT
jgi:hypothetical protein